MQASPVTLLSTAAWTPTDSTSSPRIAPAAPSLPSPWAERSTPPCAGRRRVVRTAPEPRRSSSSAKAFFSRAGQAGGRREAHSGLPHARPCTLRPPPQAGSLPLPRGKGKPWLACRGPRALPRQPHCRIRVAHHPPPATARFRRNLQSGAPEPAGSLRRARPGFVNYSLRALPRGQRHSALPPPCGAEGRAFGEARRKAVGSAFRRRGTLAL